MPALTVLHNFICIHDPSNLLAEDDNPQIEEYTYEDDNNGVQDPTYGTWEQKCKKESLAICGRITRTITISMLSRNSCY